MGKLEAGAVHSPPCTPGGEAPWAGWATAATQVCKDARWQCQEVATVTLAHLGPKQERKKESQAADEEERRVRSRSLRSGG